MDNNSLGNTQLPNSTPGAAPDVAPTPAELVAPEATPASASVGPVATSSPEGLAVVAPAASDESETDGKNYKGVYGLLIFYAICTLFYAIACFISLKPATSGSDCALLDEATSGTCSSLNNYVAISNVRYVVLAILNLASFILIMMRKRIAKWVAIATSATEPVILLIVAFSFKNFVDSLSPLVKAGLAISLSYLASGSFGSSSSYAELLDGAIASSFAAVAVSLVFSILWIIYFIKSKRVKYTLVK